MGLVERKPYGFDRVPQRKIDGEMTSFKLDADLRAAIVAEFGTQGMAAYLRRIVRADMEARGRVAPKALDAEREPIPMPVLVVEVTPPAPEPRKKRSARALGPYMSFHPAYTAWRSMRDKSRSSGIAIHPAWTDFWAFVRDMGPKPPGTVLKRHNSTRSWTPDNCIWATHREANHGRSVVPLYTIGDRTMALPDWATESGVSYATLHARVTKLGWPIEKAIRMPVAPGPGKAQRAKM